MAIALDAHTPAGIALNANPISSPQSFSHTVGNGSDRLLVVEIQMRGGSGGVVTGVTFNGVAMQQVTTEAVQDSAHATMFFLENPNSGTHTVSVAHNMTGGTYLNVSATSLTGVDQTNTLNAFNKAAANDAGPMSVAVTTTVDDCWVIDSCAERVNSDDAGTMTAVTNRVERTNALAGSGNALRGLVSTLGPAGAAGSKTMEWTKGFTREWAIMAAAFAPATTSAHNLTISDFSTGSPAVDAINFTQRQAFSVTAFSTGSPDVPAPSILTKHVFSINHFSTASPDNANPLLGGKHVLTIQDFSTTSPTYGPVTFGQKHNLSNAAFATSPPTLGPPTLQQRHALSISAFSTGSPTHDAVNLSGPGTTNFTINAVELGSPTYGPPVWQQRHVLQINSPSQSAPDIGGVLFSQRHSLSISSFSSGSPDVGTPSLALPLVGGTLKQKNVLADDHEERVLEDFELRYLSDDIELRILHHEETVPA